MEAQYEHKRQRFIDFRGCVCLEILPIQKSYLAQHEFVRKLHGTFNETERR